MIGEGTRGNFEYARESHSSSQTERGPPFPDWIAWLQVAWPHAVVPGAAAAALNVTAGMTHILH